MFHETSWKTIRKRRGPPLSLNSNPMTPTGTPSPQLNAGKQSSIERDCYSPSQSSHFPTSPPPIRPEPQGFRPIDEQELKSLTNYTPVNQKKKVEHHAIVQLSNEIKYIRVLILKQEHDLLWYKALIWFILAYYGFILWSS